MRHYRCTCGNVLFFDNSACLQCGAEIGYDLVSDQMIPLTADSAYKRCDNGVAHAVCNWVLAKDSPEIFCSSCQLNRTIPDLSIQGNREAWHRLEIAKRRILYTLARLGLVPVSKAVDEEAGLAFDFLRPTPTQPAMTGHEDGVITLNVEEAFDPEREKRRESLGEPYRTLIGHFRHEIAHYYWDRFFKNRSDDDPLLQGFRELFGDEREDYGAALQRHYQNGPKGAPGEFISDYASMHPWEDWAETWAHYMHMIDGTETANAFGLKSSSVPIPFTRFPKDVVTLPPQLTWESGEQKRFLDLLHSWAKLSPAINELVASLGHTTFYPFVFSESIIRKFYFVHHVVRTVDHVEGNAPEAEITSTVP